MPRALSQLLAVSPLNDPNTEIFLNYYDIFVRNAFGNYRDILREVGMFRLSFFVFLRISLTLPARMALFTLKLTLQLWLKC
jgi:hypothetical protein